MTPEERAAQLRRAREAKTGNAGEAGDDGVVARAPARTTSGLTVHPKRLTAATTLAAYTWLMYAYAWDGVYEGEGGDGDMPGDGEGVDDNGGEDPPAPEPEPEPPAPEQKCQAEWEMAFTAFTEARDATLAQMDSAVEAVAGQAQANFGAMDADGGPNVVFGAYGATQPDGLVNENVHPCTYAQSIMDDWAAWLDTGVWPGAAVWAQDGEQDGDGGGQEEDENGQLAECFQGLPELSVDSQTFYANKVAPHIIAGSEPPWMAEWYLFEPSKGYYQDAAVVAAAQALLPPELWQNEGTLYGVCAFSKPDVLALRALVAAKWEEEN